MPWNFCGHVHEKYGVKRLNENSIIVNLCVEVWDYYLVAFKQISSVIATFLKDEKKGEMVRYLINDSARNVWNLRGKKQRREEW